MGRSVRDAAEALYELRRRGHEVKLADSGGSESGEPRLAIQPAGGAPLSEELRTYLTRRKRALIAALQRERSEQSTGGPTPEQQRQVDRLVYEGMARHLADLEVAGTPLEGVL